MISERDDNAIVRAALAAESSNIVLSSDRDDHLLHTDGQETSSLEEKLSAVGAPPSVSLSTGLKNA